MSLTGREDPAAPIIKRSLLLLLAAVMVGCGQMRSGGVREPIVYHKVKPNETLYAVAWVYGYDYREVAGWNQLDPPYTLNPGDTLILIPPYKGKPNRSGATQPATATSDDTLNRPQSTSAVVTARNGTGVQRRTRLPPIQAPGSRVTTAPATLPTRPRASRDSALVKAGIRWHWPLRGELINRFSPDKGRKGIDIQASEGQVVKAAADGEVVYSGDALYGYGNLLIVKHNALYLSAYGYNSKLLVAEGEKVQQGQAIAHVGRDLANREALHFEIRKEGIPVQPLDYLP